MIIGLHHAQITIPEHAEEDAGRFYCGLLGLREVEKPEPLAGRGGFWLQVGGHQVHIGTEDGVNRQATKANLVYDVDDLEAYRQILRSAGAEMLEGIPIPGNVRFECRDPFGNRVELIQRSGTD
jgi:catechol 2,3-dioxygenase-like lactoylglutathione lyase family enzyme